MLSAYLNFACVAPLQRCSSFGAYLFVKYSCNLATMLIRSVRSGVYLFNTFILLPPFFTMATEPRDREETMEAASSWLLVVPIRFPSGE